MAGQNRLAEIRFGTSGGKTVVDVAVPQGTRLGEAMRLHDVLSKEIISKISPRGCPACVSGVDLFIRERFDDVIHVDLGSMKVVEK